MKGAYSPFSEAAPVTPFPPTLPPRAQEGRPPSSLSSHEQRWIEAARQGDKAAFDRLVTYHRDRLYRLMVRACHHPQDAEEVAVDALARAYEHLDQFEGRSEFVTWLNRIATRLCIRRRERHELPAVSLDAPAGGTAEDADGFGQASYAERIPDPHAASPEVLVLQAETRRILHAAVEQLPEPDQTVLRLRDIESLPTDEVSRITGLTPAAVKARLHRSRRRLRDRLDRELLTD